MTPEQELQLDDLDVRAKLASDRLQRIANLLGNNAIRRHLGVKPPQDESAQIHAYEEALKQVERITDEQERILREAGVLPE
jgi:hypothetical protein